MPESDPDALQKVLKDVRLVLTVPPASMLRSRPLAWGNDD